MAKARTRPLRREHAVVPGRCPHPVSTAVVDLDAVEAPGRSCLSRQISWPPNQMKSRFHRRMRGYVADRVGDRAHNKPGLIREGSRGLKQHVSGFTSDFCFPGDDGKGEHQAPGGCRAHHRTRSACAARPGSGAGRDRHRPFERAHALGTTTSSGDAGVFRQGDGSESFGAVGVAPTVMTFLNPASAVVMNGRFRSTPAGYMWAVASARSGAQ